MKKLLVDFFFELECLLEDDGHTKLLEFIIL